MEVNMRKIEEYEGQFEDDLHFLESWKREEQECLGNLMRPDYEWQKDVDEYEEHLRDIDGCVSNIRDLDKNIHQLKILVESASGKMPAGDPENPPK
jgi:hypothetical protein